MIVVEPLGVTVCEGVFDEHDVIDFILDKDT